MPSEEEESSRNHHHGIIREEQNKTEDESYYDQAITSLSSISSEDDDVIKSCALLIEEDEKSIFRNVVLEPGSLLLINDLKKNEKSEDYWKKKTGGATIYPQVLASLAVSLGSMIIGFASAYTATALPTMTEERNSTLVIDGEGREASWIGSLLPLGALIGGIVGGSLVEVFGRKTTILGTSVPFILSWLLISTAPSITYIYISRALVGFAIGIASLSLPVYLAETVQPEVRGTLGLMPTTIGNMGILICFASGGYLMWDQLALVGGVLSLPFLVAMLFIPETPRWYVAKGRESEALASLQWLRGASTDIRPELNEIKNTHLLSTKYAAKLSDLFGKAYLKPLLVCLSLMFFQQFSGINAVIFYTVSIFSMSGSSVDSNVATVIVGFVNIGATIGATLLIDRIGRKVLLLISEVSMVICLLSLGAFFYLKQNHPEVIEGLGFIPLVSFMLFVVGFSLGFGPIPWLMMGEILPARIRGSAAAIATAFNWSCTFIVTKSFPEFVAAFGGHSAFLSFALVCFLGIFFIIFFVPETRGRSLEEIEGGWVKDKEVVTGERLRVRRISSAANLRPMPMSM